MLANLTLAIEAIILKVALRARNTLNASEFVLSIIECGYRLPFADYPSPCFLPNNLSPVEHRAFVSQAIKELSANTCMQEHNKPPFCVNPLTAAVGKKLRLVIDLRHVNQYLVKPKFKYEGLPHHLCSWQSYKFTSDQLLLVNLSWWNDVL